jgi:asparagine synthase (glutamine-hydrolysing)
MQRRGPDGAGFFQSQGVCLGHRRLAILDPESGQQPWVDRSTGVTLVFNGELYNYKALRKELSDLGVQLETSCDTELLLQAYLYWGRACLARIDGMFAFAFYDPREQCCWLARDRLGVKPLYYHFAAGQLRFASSMKALFAFPEVERRVDVASVLHYLRTIRTSLGSRTLVDGVHSLEPGSALYWSWERGGEPDVSSYWQLPHCRSRLTAAEISFEEASAETRRLLSAAVERQMLSDVPLGGFLSGGIDSSILSHLASSHAGSQFGTFSVGYDQEGFHEWRSIRENAKHHGLQNQEIRLHRADYLSDWSWLIGEKGLPLSTPNEVPIYRLAEAFGSQYKVALSGEGADEVFGGYLLPTFTAFDWDRMSNGVGAIDPECFQAAYGSDASGSRQEHFFRMNSWIPKDRVSCLLYLPDRALDREDPVDAYYAKLFREYADDSTFSAYLKVHARVNLEGLLSRLDSSTMAASVEGRVPFTDHTLVEWLFRLPDRYKMDLQAGLRAQDVRRKSVYDLEREGLIESKRLLRNAFAGCVPARILKQRKVSFPVPFFDMFELEWRALYRSMLQSSCGPAQLLRAEVRAALASQDSVDAMLAWPLVNLFLWQQECGIDFSS